MNGSIILRGRVRSYEKNFHENKHELLPTLIFPKEKEERIYSKESLSYEFTVKDVFLLFFRLFFIVKWKWMNISTVICVEACGCQMVESHVFPVKGLKGD